MTVASRPVAFPVEVTHEVIHIPHLAPRTVPLIRPDLPTLAEVGDAFSDILASGRLSNFGPYATRFENALTERLGASTVTVSSGTAGLVFALQALGVKAGDKVALPSFTFVATAQAVLYAGAEPVYIDIAPDFTMAPDDLAAALTANPEIAAVIAVHTYGLPAKVDELAAIVDDASARAGRRIPLIYDAAHALGSAVGDRPVGGFGDAEVFSLSATKTLVAGEGGLVVSRHAEVIDKIKAMRNYGFAGGYDANGPGLNGKMSEFHAAIGLHNLARLDDLMAARTTLAAAYADRIANDTVFSPPPVRAGTTHTFKDYCVMVPERLAGQRDAIAAWLREHGVEVRTYFSPALHKQQYFTRFDARALPVTDDLAARVISIPFFASMTEDEMEYVVDHLRQVGEIF